MDLGWRVQPPRWEKVRKYNYIQKSERNWVNSVTAFLEDPYYKEEFHTYARARFVNASARNNCSALIFGDSYSRPSPDALTGMLAETMRSVEFIWSSSVDWTLVNRMRPDILIVQTAERFLARLPNDRRSLRLAEARQDRLGPVPGEAKLELEPLPRAAPAQQHALAEATVSHAHAHVERHALAHLGDGEALVDWVLRAYETDPNMPVAARDESFQRRCLAYTLLHTYANLPWFLDRLGEPLEGPSYEALARRWWALPARA